MRVLIFHGYLLSGTGSNVYNARLAEALVKLGHEVHLFSQDRHPLRQPFVSASGEWDADRLRLQAHGGAHPDHSAPCTVYRPNLGGLLPVYVPDRYEGIEAKTFAQCSEGEVASYIDANVQAVREVAELVRPDLALANHLVMGPVILARALPESTPYAVKVHGSALEYTVKREPERFLSFAREGLARAKTVLVGSRHTAESLWEALEDPDLRTRTRLGPPGVDVERFAPCEPARTETTMRGLIEKLRQGRSEPTGEDEQASAFARDDAAAAAALTRVADGSGPLVAFVGKLIVSKGVDLLIAAWPLVLRAVPAARLLIVGFGAYREGLELLIARLSAGDLDGAKEIARAGRGFETSHASTVSNNPAESSGGPPLRHLLAFLDSLSDAEADEYREEANAMSGQVVLVGRLDHDELADVLPACEALVVPSTFPEAFGMVAVEAAACGVLPINAAHSGLAEVSDTIAGEVPQQVAEWLSFPVDDGAVRAIAEHVVDWLEADCALKQRAREQLASVARERWSWQGVAGGVIAAALGEGVSGRFPERV